MTSTNDEMPEWIVDDDTPKVLPGQVHKSEFVAAIVRALTEKVIAWSGQPLSDESCKSFAFWVRFYSTQDAAHIERATLRLIGPDKQVANALDYVPLLVEALEERTRARRDARRKADGGRQ